MSGVPQRLELAPPSRVVADAEAVVRAGGRALLVGGAVRDRLLGLEVDDWDLATDLLPGRLASVLTDVSDVDESLGRVAVGDGIVWTTMRAEADYDERRRPRRVRFVTTPDEDAQRRDFTINAIYAEVLDGTLVDPCGGLGDLRARRLEMIGDPEVRLLEDPLRPFRAVRLAARYGLSIATPIERALRRADGSAVSADRFRDECELAWTRPGRGPALRLLAEFDLLRGHLGAARGAVELAADVLESVPVDRPAASWAAVFSELVLADAAGGPGRDAATEIRAQLERLGFRRDLRERIAAVVRDSAAFGAALDRGRDGWAAWLRRPHLDDLCALEHARRAARGIDGSSLDELGRAVAALPARPLVDGRDVLALGVRVGPLVGEILQRARLEIDVRGISAREPALGVLRAIVDDVVKDGGSASR